MIEAELTKPQWGISAATAVAARVLAGLEQRQVAAKAKIDASTLHRMEASEDKPTRGHAANVERVVEVLRKAGVEMTNEPRSVRLISRK